MHEYRIGFGIGERANGSAISKYEQRAILDAIEHMAAWEFGGYNLTFGRGGWVNPQGRLVREQSATLSILVNDESASMDFIHKFADNVRFEADQHSVILIHPDGSAEFVEG